MTSSQASVRVAYRELMRSQSMRPSFACLHLRQSARHRTAFQLTSVGRIDICSEPFGFLLDYFVFSLFQAPFRASRSSSYCGAISATSWSRSTSRRCWSSYCRGCRSGSMSRRLPHASPSVCWPFWRWPPSRRGPTLSCPRSPTSRPSMSGCRCASFSCSSPCSSTPSSTFLRAGVACASFIRYRDLSSASRRCSSRRLLRRRRTRRASSTRYELTRWQMTAAAAANCPTRIRAAHFQPLVFTIRSRAGAESLTTDGLVALGEWSSALRSAFFLAPDWTGSVGQSVTSVRRCYHGDYWSVHAIDVTIAAALIFRIQTSVHSCTTRIPRPLTASRTTTLHSCREAIEIHVTVNNALFLVDFSLNWHKVTRKYMTIINIFFHRIDVG